MGETSEPTVSEKVAQVWAHYERVIPKYGSYVLDAATVTVIRNALKVRTVDQCCEAIDGLARSKWHNGQNEARKRYLAIRYALKGNSSKGEGNAERIDKMRDIAKENPTTTVVSTLPSAGREMVRERERHIRQSLENPGDEDMEQRRILAEVWFAETVGLRGPSLDPEDHRKPLRWQEGAR